GCGRGRRADPRKPGAHHRRAADARREDPDGTRSDAFAAAAHHGHAAAGSARRADGERTNAGFRRVAAPLRRRKATRPGPTKGPTGVCLMNSPKILVLIAVISVAEG